MAFRYCFGLSCVCVRVCFFKMAQTVDDAKPTGPDTTKQQEKEEDDGQFVDPWTVVSDSEKGIDYEKLISKSVSYGHFQN